MMDGIGQYVANAFVTMAILAFGAGVAFAALAWALWYFVLSHVSITWGWT